MHLDVVMREAFYDGHKNGLGARAPRPMSPQVRKSARQKITDLEEAVRPATPLRTRALTRLHGARGSPIREKENVAPVEVDTCFTPQKRLRRTGTPIRTAALNMNVDSKEVKECQSEFELVIESNQVTEQSFPSPFNFPAPANFSQIQAKPSTGLEQARKLFHKSTHVRIIGRSTERSVIETFWQNSVVDKSSSKQILYICGTPGTGKTALLREMLPDLFELKPVIAIERNCMMYEDAMDILHEINLDILGNKAYSRPSVSSKNKDDICRAIKAELIATGRRTIFILDEIDHLATSDLDLLQTIFTWASDPSCMLTIIGIANSIDLTARYVPESIQSQTETLYFCPYQMEDIIAILNDRMARANVDGQVVIDPAAVELCSRKVAAVGDLRKALEIMQIAFDNAESEEGCTRVQFSHVIKAMDKAFASNTTKNGAGKLIEQLNMNARMVLVSLILFQDENPIPAGSRLPYKKPTLQNIFDRYVNLLRTSAGRSGMLMNPVSRDEYQVLLTDMETFGVIKVVQSTGTQGPKKKSFSLLQDWQASLIKLSVLDRESLVSELKNGSITRLFL